MKPAPLLLCALPLWTALAQTSSSSDALRAAVELQMTSIARQRESVRLQAESARPWPGRLPEAAPPDCATMPEEAVGGLIEGAAKSHQLNPGLLRAVIAQESAFRPCAVSRAGAQGLMQLMPATAGELGVTDPFDARQSIDGGARFLKQLLNRYQGNLSQALGAYNAGPAAVENSGAIFNFPETREFVRSVLDKLKLTRTDPPSIPMPTPIEN